MSLTEAPHSFKKPSTSEELSAPGKVFLCGEYAALAGLPAAVLCLAPRFRAVKRGPVSGQSFSDFPVRSPVGRLLHWARAFSSDLPELGEFLDPVQGAGGFGASTAQFILAYTQLARHFQWEMSWQQAWKLYRELMSDEPQIPSGADLVAQALGGLVVFTSAELKVERLGGAAETQLEASASLLIFAATNQAGRKVATHEHLRMISERQLVTPESEFIKRLADPLAEALGGLHAGSVSRLGPALTEYAGVLAAYDLEAPAARADRLALSQLPGVFGVKGCGAMLADAVMVCVQPDSETRGRVIQAAQARQLILVPQPQAAQAGAAGITG